MRDFGIYSIKISYSFNKWVKVIPTNLTTTDISIYSSFFLLPSLTQYLLRPSQALIVSSKQNLISDHSLSLLIP